MRTTLKMSAFAALTAFTVVATGCSGSTQMGPSGGPPGPTEMPGPSPSPGPKPSPSPGPGPSPVANFSGPYAAISPIDLTQNGVLPGVIGPILSGLSYLHSCPGYSILKWAATAGVNQLDYTWNTSSMPCPTTSNFVGSLLQGALTSVIQSQLYQGVPLANKIAEISEGITEMFRLMEIREKLTIGAPDQAMGVDVEQQINAVAFTTFNVQTVVPLASGSLPAAYAKTRGSLAPRVAAPVADANLSFAAAPALSVPVGQLAYDALMPIILVPIAGQTTLAATLAAIVDCNGLGQSVTNSGNSFISSLGGLVTTVCSAAVVGVAGAIEQAIKAIKLDGSQVDGVTGVLYDVSAARPQIDYTSDQLAEGHVTWNFSGTNIPSTLTATRMYQ